MLKNEKETNVLAELVAANPNKAHDYIVDLEGTISGGVEVFLRYVPDSFVISGENYNKYLKLLEDSDYKNSNLEELAGIMLEDLNNELLPRWIRFKVRNANHKVIIEDRQPGWQNSELMDTMGLI